MTESPRAVAREALALAREALPAYSVTTSREGHAQHQLFAVPALKTSLKTDYRGTAQHLKDVADLRADLGLVKVPHDSTPCHAAGRLLGGGAVVGLLVRATASARDRGLIGDRPTAAVDATGPDGRHTSRYFAARSGRDHAARAYTKLTVACDTASHFFAGATVAVGPTNASPRFTPVMTFAALAVAWGRVLADAAFDAAAHHRLAREESGVRSTVIPAHARGHAGPPAGRHRGRMARRFRPRPEGSRSTRVSGRRWAAESAFSRHKRLLGGALGGKSDASREREGFRRVLTHNLMPLAAVK